MAFTYIINDHRRWAALLIPGSGCEILLGEPSEGLTDGGVPRLQQGLPPALYRRFVVWREPVVRFITVLAQEGAGVSVEGWLDQAEQELLRPGAEQDVRFRRQCDFSAHLGEYSIIAADDLEEWFYVQGWGRIPRSAEAPAVLLSPDQEDRVRELYAADYQIPRTDWRTEIAQRPGVLFHREFRHVFLINLDSRPDRLASANRVLAREGIVAERLAAVDGARVRRLHSYDRPGAYALALRLRLILRRALREGWESVFFLEDDIVLVDDLQERLSRVQLPEVWDMFYLGGVHGQAPVDITVNLVRCSGTTSTHAIGFSRRVFLRAMDALRPPPRNTTRKVVAMDRAFAWMHNNIYAYACLPNLAWQSTGYSDLEQRTYGVFSLDGVQEVWPENLRPAWEEQLAAELDEVAAEDDATLIQVRQTAGEIAPWVHPSSLEPVQQFAWTRSIRRIFHIVLLERERLTPEQEASLDGWRRLHPHWSFVLWTGDVLPPLRMGEGYRRLRSAAAKVMWLRCEILLRYGGICLDPALECLQPLDGLIAGLGGILVRDENGALSTCLMGACPGQSFFQHLLEMAGATRDLDANIASQGVIGFTSVAWTTWRLHNSCAFALEDAAAEKESGTLCRDRFAFFQEWLFPVVTEGIANCQEAYPHAYGVRRANGGTASA